MLTTLKTKIEERCEDLERMGRVTEADGLAWALKVIDETEEEQGVTADWSPRIAIIGGSQMDVYECSHCKLMVLRRLKYCPECGARMEDVK